MEFAEKVQQVDQGAAQAIDRPGRDHVDVAAGDGLQQAIEAGALVAALGAGDTGVLEKLDHAPTMARGDLLEFTSLIFGRLLGGGDPKINRDALLDRIAFRHGRFPLQALITLQTGAKGIADNGSVGLPTKNAA
jgi:hypothetical protein